MDKKTLLPIATAAFIVAVGLLFLSAALLDLPALRVKSPENHALAGVAVFFLLFGCVYGYLLATEDSDMEVREAAQERLQEVAS